MRVLSIIRAVLWHAGARRLAIVGLTAGLAACASITPSPAVQVVIADGGTATDAAYNVAAQLYAADAANLSPATKASVKALFAQLLTCPAVAAQPCTGYVAAADQAASIADATTLAAQASAAQTLITQITTILKGA